MADAPTDPRIEAAILPPFLLQTLAVVAARHGVAAELLCRGLGLDPAELDDPARLVSFRQAGEMIRRALKLVPVPALGLLVGAENVLGTLGLIGHAMTVSRTLGDAIGIGMRYQVIAGGVTRSELVVDGPLAWLDSECRFPDAGIEVFALEEVFSSCLQYARALAGPGFAPLRVEFAHRDPGHRALCERAFGTEVAFDCPRSRIIVEARRLDAELPGHAPLALRQALALLEQQAGSARQRLDLAESVERAILRSLGAGARIEVVARQLNISSRTLRRRLAEHGQSFETLLDGARRDRALALLARGRLSLAQIAAETGYGDVRSLRRAVRRWTGRSPSQFRS